MDFHGGNRGNQHTGGKVPSRNLGDLGIKKKQSHHWQLIAGYPIEKLERYFATSREGKKEITSAGIVKLAKQRRDQAERPLPTKLPDGFR